MRMKKLLAAALAGCTALSSVPFLSAFAEGPSETAAPDLVFEFRTDDGSNEVTISTEDLTGSDQSVNVKLYVPSNPGVNAISLKMQINDGEVDEDDIFHNYGITMTSGKYASPYCFDSENEGDSQKSFQQMLTASQMNLMWTYRYSQEENADSSSEEGKTSWDDSVSWAYDKAFAEMTLNIPKETPVGEYVFDIRRDPYINAVTLGADKKWPARSACAAAGSETVDFKSVPLTIIVAEPETTTTTEETTTSESTTTTEQTTSVETTTTTKQTTSVETTTTTKQTTSVETTTTTKQTTSVESTTSTEQTTVITSIESVPDETTSETSAAEAAPIENSYADMADGMFMVVGDASGAPGEKVKVPVCVYNDPGTAGMALYWVFSDGLTVSRITSGGAYLGSAQPSSKTTPISFVFTCPEGKDQKAEDGAVICYITFTIPEDAPDGNVYKVEWIEEGGKTIPNLDKYSEACNTDRVSNKPKFFPGTITVNATGEPRLNYDSLNFTKSGDQTKLAVLNATGTGLKWSSSDDAVASVADNGMVTANANSGDCEIYAKFRNAAGKDVTLTCKVHIGLFGDVDCDGEITLIDTVLVLIGVNEDMIGLDAEYRTLTPEQVKIGDVDGDGELSPYDSSCILKYYNLKIVAGIDDITWDDVLPKKN